MVNTGIQATTSTPKLRSNAAFKLGSTVLLFTRLWIDIRRSLPYKCILSCASMLRRDNYIRFVYVRLPNGGCPVEF